MNHLCMENNTGEESNGEAAVRGEPSQGARLSDSKRKEIGTEPGEVMPKKEALDDNMRNDLRTPAGRIEKNDGQPDETSIRKKELANANTTIDDNMSNDFCTPALTVRID